jgi:hypothetical protein
MITKDELTARIIAATSAQKSLKAKAVKGVAESLKNPTLAKFQALDGTLTADGRYGKSSKSALIWYLQGMSDKTVPNVPPAYANAPDTWKPPELAKPAPAPATAPVIPRAATPTTPRTSSGSGSLFGGISDSVGELRKKAAALQAKAPVVAKAQAQVKAKAKKKVKKIAKAIGPLPAFGQELLAQNIGKVDAEDVISAVAAGAPIVSNVLKSMDAESNIANEFAKIQGKGLKGIKKTLLRGALQKDATSEHRSLTKRDNFRKTVLAELKNIKGQLAAKKAGKGGDDYRIVGLLL